MAKYRTFILTSKNLRVKTCNRSMIFSYEDTKFDIMNNLLILEVQDLRRGDVVLTHNNCEIYEAKLMTDPKPLVPRGKYSNTHWWNGVRRWSTIKCEVREEKVVYTPTKGGNPWTATKLVVANGQPYNTVKRVEFSGKKVIVIKRDDI